MIDFEGLLNETPEDRDARRSRIEEERLALIKKEKDEIDWLCSIESGLTDWEMKFIDSVAKQHERDGYLSDKQWSIVRRILKEKG